MPTIIGREPEISVLSDLCQQDEAVFLALYGRRRVGKTFLIHEFFQDRGIFFELTGSKQAAKSEQLKNFQREFLRVFPQQQTTQATSWSDAFYQLHEAIETIPPTQKVVLFFDELPWLASPKSGFLAALEHIWNRHLSRRMNLFLIICGSAAAWMIKKVVNNQAGLYGRLTRVMPLYPFKLPEVKQLLTTRQVDLTNKQMVELFMTFGGVGAYLNHIKPGKSVTQIVNELCFQPSAPLFLEFNNLLASLFTHPEKHLAIIRVLAQKRRGLLQEDLLKTAGLLRNGRSSEVLEELEACGFIMPIPVFGKPKRDKKFRLMDEYSYFYLTWIEPHYQTILHGTDTEYWQKVFRSPGWLSYAGYAFENVCWKHLLAIKKALGIAGVATQESYWQYQAPRGTAEKDKGAEIDLIIQRADGCIHLCEIKFTDDKFTIDKAYAEQLIQKREVFRQKARTKDSLFITFITPYGVADNSYCRDLVQNQVIVDDLF